MVDLSGVAELKGIRESGDGLEIGAMTTLTEVVRHPVVRERYGILLEGAESAASPQIRNQGHDRRQRDAGRALLVLPRGLAVLSRRRQHLLRRYARSRSTASTRSSAPIAVSPSTPPTPRPRSSRSTRRW